MHATTWVIFRQPAAKDRWQTHQIHLNRILQHLPWLLRCSSLQLDTTGQQILQHLFLTLMVLPLPIGERNLIPLVPVYFMLRLVGLRLKCPCD